QASFRNEIADAPQIVDKVVQLRLLSLIAQPQDIGGVDGHQSIDALTQPEHTATAPGDGYNSARERACCCSAQSHNQPWVHQLELLVQPPAATLDLVSIGPLVNTALAAQDVLKVLHRVGDVDPRPVDACLLQGPIENTPGWPHERMAGLVLAVARLLA